jgi:transposase
MLCPCRGGECRWRGSGGCEARLAPVFLPPATAVCSLRERWLKFGGCVPVFGRSLMEYCGIPVCRFSCGVGGMMLCPCRGGECRWRGSGGCEARLAPVFLPPATAVGSLRERWLKFGGVYRLRVQGRVRVSLLVFFLIIICLIL